MKSSSKDRMGKSIDYLLGICLVDKPPVPKTIHKTIKWTIQQELGYYATTATPKQTLEFDDFAYHQQQASPVKHHLAKLIMYNENKDLLYHLLIFAIQWYYEIVI